MRKNATRGEIVAYGADRIRRKPSTLSHYPGYTEQNSNTTTTSWMGRTASTTTRTYHGGGSSTRREWTDVAAALYTQVWYNNRTYSVERVLPRSF